MSRIGDRSFMFAWQAIRAATQPGPEATRWTVAGVQWRRSRYSLMAPDHSATCEVHRLDRVAGLEGWSLMVVIEHWWDEKRNPLRNQVWATHVAGSRFRIAEWITQQSKTLDRSKMHGHDAAEPDE